MFLKYGTYSHAAGECVLRGIMREGLKSENGLIYAFRETWDIEGMLQITDQGSAAANQTLMTSTINSLKTAYNVNGRDLGFYDDNGVVTSHFLDSSTSTTGVQIVQPPSFPLGGGAEYSTFRNYSLRAEATFGYTGSGGKQLVFWAETLSFRGTGGPTWGYLVPLNGPAQKQYLTETSTYWAFQRGEATGNQFWPIVPAPLYPYAEHQQQREIQYSIPRGSAGKRMVTWSYVFEGIRSFDGRPQAKLIN